MEPIAGLSDQVTAVFVVPVTLAVNCCVWVTIRLAVEGVTAILTGTSVMEAEALTPAAVAVTVTIWAVTEEGAV